MEFREDIGQYVFEYEGLIFAWDEEPEEDIQDTVKTLANNYFKHLDGIIDFMLPDIKEIYGQVTVEDVKRNLGRPIVDYDNGKVTYCEQSFDDCHIFEFEFMDDAFEKLQYFSIDGQQNNIISLSICPLREEKSFSQRAFSIYTGIRKL